MQKDADLVDEERFRIHPLVLERILESQNLASSEIMEIEVEGVAKGPERWELDEALKAIEGLKVSGYEVKAFDFPMLLTLAGSAGSLIQATDVLLKWWTVRRAASNKVRLEVRTEQGGKLDLTTATMEQARELLGGVVQMLDQTPRHKKTKRLPPRSSRPS